MSGLSGYYKQAELSFAAYSNLSRGMTKENYIVALEDNNDGLSLTQATAFAATYSVVDQYTDVCGVSATAFKDKEGKSHYQYVVLKAPAI